MSSQIQTLFTEISPTYDKLNHLLSFNIDKIWRKKTIQLIKQGKEEKINALDLCAGTLDLSIEFLKQYENGSVTSLDFSQAMLDHGKKKLTKAELARSKIICGDALKLPFENEMFDVVFCAYGFRNLTDPKKGLQEINRVLKPGGQVLLLEFFRPQKAATRLFHKTYSRFLLPTLGRLVSKHTGAYQYLHESIGKFLSVEETKNIMHQCGLKPGPAKDLFLGISSIVTGDKP